MHATRIDGSGVWGRRFKELYVDITNELGGPDVVSELERQLIRRAASLAVLFEQCGKPRNYYAKCV